MPRGFVNIERYSATPPAPTIQTEGYYKGERGNDFKITVAPNPVDGTEKDI